MLLDELFQEVADLLELRLGIWPYRPELIAIELVFWYEDFPEEMLDQLIPLIAQWQSYRRLARQEELREMRRRGV